MKFHWYSGQNNTVFVQYTSICLPVIFCINLNFECFLNLLYFIWILKKLWIN